MTLPKNRSSSVKRVPRRTPSGRISVHYKREKPSAAHCAICKAVLGGTSWIESRPPSPRITRAFLSRPPMRVNVRSR